eukprot:jgi/Bigna1/74219/fgenesh1_pg.28_\
MIRDYDGEDICYSHHGKDKTMKGRRGRGQPKSANIRAWVRRPSASAKVRRHRRAPPAVQRPDVYARRTRCAAEEPTRRTDEAATATKAAMTSVPTTTTTTTRKAAMIGAATTPLLVLVLPVVLCMHSLLLNSPIRRVGSKTAHILYLSQRANPPRFCRRSSRFGNKNGSPNRAEQARTEQTAQEQASARTAMASTSGTRLTSASRESSFHQDYGAITQDLARSDNEEEGKEEKKEEDNQRISIGGSRRRLRIKTLGGGERKKRSIRFLGDEQEERVELTPSSPGKSLRELNSSLPKTEEKTALESSSAFISIAEVAKKSRAGGEGVDADNLMSSISEKRGTDDGLLASQRRRRMMMRRARKSRRGATFFKSRINLLGGGTTMLKISRNSLDAEVGSGSRLGARPSLSRGVLRAMTRRDLFKGSEKNKSRIIGTDSDTIPEKDITPKINHSYTKYTCA